MATATNFNSLLERATNNIDKGFKRASNSFDESCKQIQTAYDEAVRSTHPRVVATPSTSNANKVRRRFDNYVTTAVGTSEAMSTRRHHKNQKRIMSIPSWGSGETPPIPKFRDYATDKPYFKKTRNPSSVPIRTNSKLSTAPSPTPFDEASQPSVHPHSPRTTKQDALYDEEGLSNPRISKQNSLVKTDRAAFPTSVDSFLGYHPAQKRTITRTHHLAEPQNIGLEFMTLNIQEERGGSILLVSKIEPFSVFASSDLQVGDAVLSINGVTFRQNDNSDGSACCKPDALIARKLLEKGWDGSPTTTGNHRGRNSPKNSRRRWQATLEYVKFDGISNVRSPDFRQIDTSATPDFRQIDTSASLQATSTFSSTTKTMEESTFFSVDDEDEDVLCTTEPCSSAAAALVAAVTDTSTSLSKFDGHNKKSLWARAFLKLHPSKDQSPQKMSTSPPEVISPKKEDINLNQSSTGVNFTRLEELRARNHQLRIASNQQIEASKKRLLSSHIESSRPKLLTGEINHSCESPDNLASQLEQEKKRQFTRNEEVLNGELLPDTPNSRLDTTVDTIRTSGNAIHFARSHQETLMKTPKTSVSSDADENKDLDAASDDSSHKSPSLQSKQTTTPGDASGRSTALIEGQDRNRNTVQMMDEHHQELNRLNERVTQKLRSKVDSLTRSNIQLSEEIAALRVEDKQKSEAISKWQKRMEENKQYLDTLQKDLEMYKSRLRFCSQQADKRQQKLLHEIAKKDQHRSDQVETLLKRIGILERDNRKLMSELQAKENQGSRSQLETDIKELKIRLLSQNDTMEGLVHTHDKLRRDKMDLQKQLRQYQSEKEDNNPKNVTAEIAICSARSSFLEEQNGSFEHQIEMLKEEVRLEREKRLLCQRELEEALVKLSDQSYALGMGTGNQSVVRNLSFHNEVENSSNEKAREQNGTFPVTKTNKKHHEENLFEEKKLMEFGDW